MGARRLDPDVEKVLERGHRLGEEGDWEGMALLLAEALENHPGDPFLLCWLGVAERELGLDNMAYEHFKASLAARPGDPHVLATAGNALAAFDDPDAEPALRSAAVMAPGLALARWMYGAYLAREGLLDEALRELRTARDLDPDNASVAYELGVALALSGNQGDAGEAFYGASRLRPEDSWIHVVLGLSLLADDRGDEAVSELVEGARLRPEDLEAQLLASLAAASVGADGLAWEMLERGRFVARGRAETTLAEEVEELLGEGADAARTFLLEEWAPSAYRARLSERP